MKKLLCAVAIASSAFLASVSLAEATEVAEPQYQVEQMIEYVAVESSVITEVNQTQQFERISTSQPLMRLYQESESGITLAYDRKYKPHIMTV